MLGSIKIHHVILALLMSMAMMLAMAGPATAAGCSNPTHQHYFSLNSTNTMPSMVASNETTIKSFGEETILVADKETEKFSSYNKTGIHRVFADSGSGYLYARSGIGIAKRSNRQVMVVAFKHRIQSDAWDDVKRQ